MVVDGLVPSNATVPGTLPAPAELRAADQILITAAGSINLGVSSLLQVATATGEVRLNAGNQATVSGTVGAGAQIVIGADAAVTLDGRLTAGDLVDVRAGLGTAGTGAVTGTKYATLLATHAGGIVRLTAGVSHGDMTLNLSQLTAAGRIELLAPPGLVADSAGLLTAPPTARIAPPTARAESSII